MRFQLIFSSLFLGSMVMASPILCPDSKRDAILAGNLDPSVCCSYGKCLKDVVVESG